MRDFVTATVIPKTVIDFKGVTEIPFGLGSIIDYELDGFPSALPKCYSAQNAAGLAIYEGGNVDPVFFSPIKVKSSSSSAFSTFSGTGAAGKLSA